eukprot:GEMP01014650.1.p1 GENE.GEMP01014650.1~~GEMP01014650.1.p1  ORF type:complete len:743 (+),score=169.02 GEMP01014650.1:75-2231(+)
MPASLKECAVVSPRISLGGAHAILWVTLISFVALGIAHGAYVLVQKARAKTLQEAAVSNSDTIDAFLSGRGNITDWKSLGVSLFSSVTGQWVLFFTPYIGWTQGWWGVFGQSVSWIGGMFLVSALAPHLERQMQEHNIYAVTDWICVRYSRAFQIYVSVIMFFILIVFAGIELATIADVYDQNVPDSLRHASMPITVIWATCLAVYLYTALNGFASTVFTDLVQGVLVLLIACPVIMMIIVTEENIIAETIATSSRELATPKIFMAALATNVSLFWAVLLDFTLWQRVFSVRDKKVARKAILMGATLICPFLSILSTVGLLLRGTCEGYLNSYNLLFIKAGEQGIAWIVINLILLTTLVTSTLDSLLYAGLSIVSAKIVAWDAKDDDKTEQHGAAKDEMEGSVVATSTGTFAVLKMRFVKRVASRTFFRINAFLIASVVGIGIMASIIQNAGKTVVLGNMFYICNILTSSLVLPIFAGIFLPITNFGAIFGAVSGLITCVIYGTVEFEGQFMAGIEMLGLMIFISDTTRQALEHKFCLMPLEVALCDSATITAINTAANPVTRRLPSSALPIYFDDVNYRPFVRHFATEVQAILDDKLSTWYWAPDVAMRPRTVILFFLVPLVTFVVSYAVSKFDPTAPAPSTNTIVPPKEKEDDTAPIDEQRAELQQSLPASEPDGPKSTPANMAKKSKSDEKIEFVDSGSETAGVKPPDVSLTVQT